VAGGHHATLVPADFCLRYVNAVCLGQGEPVFPALIAAIDAGRSLKAISNLVWREESGSWINNGRVHGQVDMNGLPQPRRDLVAKHRGEYFFQFKKPVTAVAIAPARFGPTWTSSTTDT
jgi:radical SAM superfamily enzyme YgiQ (UPF0313 family)